MGSSGRGVTPSRLRRLVYWSDEAFRVPFTQFRFGLDAILGLILPGVGDSALALAGVPLIYAAWRRGHRWRVLLLMSLNVLLDATVGAVPIVGDVFDFFWKAQTKNLLLLEQPHQVGAVWAEAKGHIVVLSVVCGLLLVGLIGVLWMLARFGEEALRGWMG